MQKSNRPVYIIVSILLLVIIISVARGAFDKASEKNSGPIKVGVIAPFSGVVADYGEQVRKGVEAANISDTSRIQFIFEDDQCDAKTAISAFKKLTDFDKVHYIIGPACGSPQSAIAPLLVGRDTLAIVPSAASRGLYAMSEGHLYNMQYALEDEAKFIAEEMYARGFKNVAVISYQNDFSQVEVDSFKKNFKGNIVRELSYANDVSDVQTELTKIKSGGYDAVFVADISFYFGGGLKKMHTLGIDVPVFSPYPVELPAVRSLVDGVYYSFASDITDGKGGVFGISQQSAELLAGAFAKCGDDYRCVKSFVDTSGFDQTGVKQRTLILKQIKGGEPVVVGK